MVAFFKIMTTASSSKLLRNVYHPFHTSTQAHKNMITLDWNTFSSLIIICMCFAQPEWPAVKNKQIAMDVELFYVGSSKNKKYRKPYKT